MIKIKNYLFNSFSKSSIKFFPSNPSFSDCWDQMNSLLAARHLYLHNCYNYARRFLLCCRLDNLNSSNFQLIRIIFQILGNCPKSSIYKWYN